MRATYVWSLSIAALLSIWLFSGQINSAPVEVEPSIAEQNRVADEVGDDTLPTRVRAQRVRAVEKIRYANIRGKTQNKRTVTARAELVGRVVDRRVERGDAVTADTVLCELSVEDRQSALVEAHGKCYAKPASTIKGRLNYRLKALIQKARLPQRKRDSPPAAQLKRKELAVEKILVRAPFDGVVEDVHVEIGDYVNLAKAARRL